MITLRDHELRKFAMSCVQRFRHSLAIHCLAVCVSAGYASGQETVEESGITYSVASSAATYVDMGAALADQEAAGHVETAVAERKLSVFSRVINFILPVGYTQDPETGDSQGITESGGTEQSLVEVELLPITSASDAELNSGINFAHSTLGQSQKLIDPALCERAPNFDCENPSILDAMPAPCGQCNACRCGNPRHVACERVSSFVKRTRYIYDRTLLGDPRLFCERKFGSYLDAVMNAQIESGKREQMALYEYDFEQHVDGSPTSKVKATSLQHLEQIAVRMLQTGSPLIIEQTGNVSLDNRRRTVVVQQLTNIGLRTNPDSVISGNPLAPGTSGVEAEIQFRSRMLKSLRGGQTPEGASGNGAASGFSSGN